MKRPREVTKDSRTTHMCKYVDTSHNSPILPLFLIPMPIPVNVNHFVYVTSRKMGVIISVGYALKCASLPVRFSFCLSDKHDDSVRKKLLKLVHSHTEPIPNYAFPSDPMSIHKCATSHASSSSRYAL